MCRVVVLYVDSWCHVRFLHVACGSMRGFVALHSFMILRMATDCVCIYHPL